jgi:putative transposase
LVFNETIKYLRSCINFLPTIAEVKNDLLKNWLPRWCDDIPLKIKVKAVKEAYQAFKLAEANPMTRAKTIKLEPTSEQKHMFKKWNDCSRYVYNQTIDYIRSCVNFSPSWMEIRLDLLKQLPKWCEDVPFQIKGNAVKEAHQAYSSAQAHPKFRSRKNPTQSCYIPKSAIKETGIYPRVSGKNLHYSEALPDEPLDGRLVYQYNEWFLSVPQKVETRQCTLNQGRVVALDPGVRTFQTFYSEFAAGQIGYDDFGRIQRLCFYLDDLISRTSKVKSKAKRRLRDCPSKNEKEN